MKNFYPRSPRGERHPLGQVEGVHRGFLSTLPARGATKAFRGLRRVQAHFYPRSPRGERPVSQYVFARFFEISIHAPREGSDRTFFTVAL